MVDYFEIPELPGRKFFRCEPLRASITMEECGRRWHSGNMGVGPAANSDDADVSASPDASMRCMTCKGCVVGARHAGVQSANLSHLKGAIICGRCHQGCTRLIGKHLCVSCYNRQREYLLGKNAKGTKPVKLAPLHRRIITYVSAGQLRTKTLEHSVDMDELIVTVLRDEPHAVKLIPTLPANFLALRALEGA